MAEAWAAAEGGSRVHKVKVTLWVAGSVGVREKEASKETPGFWPGCWVDGAGCHWKEKH